MGYFEAPLFGDKPCAVDVNVQKRDEYETTLRRAQGQRQPEKVFKPNLCETSP